MQLLLLLTSSTDPTTLSYWLNWRVLLCATWVLIPMIFGFYLIWKFEGSDTSESNGEKTEEEESLRVSSYVAAWKPCLEDIHPIFLLVFRIIAFCLLFVAITFDVALHGFQLYYYYTQWTFTLITIYFGIGSLISLHGCIHHHRNSKYNLSKDTENGLYTALSPGLNGKRDILLERLEHPGKFHFLLSSSFWGDMFQILFQMTAGAVAITDLVYWCVMYPFLDIKEYQMNFLTVVAHTLNAVTLFGDIALNSMKFPWFRIAYFVFLTSMFVLFQWIVHAAESMWWPYPFLELSSDYAPLWYLIVALLHLPCYGIFIMVVKAKHLLLTRWFPNSFCYAHEIIS